MHFKNSKCILLLVCSFATTFLHVESIHVCGDALSDMLSQMCRKGFNYVLKRSEGTMHNSNGVDTESNKNNALNNYEADTKINYEKLPLLYAMLGENARNQLLSTRRRRFAPYDECCLKSCTIQELNEFCLK